MFNSTKIVEICSKTANGTEKYQYLPVKVSILSLDFSPIGATIKTKAAQLPHKGKYYDRKTNRFYPKNSRCEAYR